MARAARIIDSMGRGVVEGIAGRALVEEGERKHDGEDGEIRDSTMAKRDWELMIVFPFQPIQPIDSASAKSELQM